jgi:peptidyl-prolyl cis-trans isomerase D
MLSSLRNSLNTWAVRALFFVLVLAFVLWGVGDVLRTMGGDTAVARVGDARIEAPQLQEAFQRQLAQVTRMLGGKADAPPEMRRAVASQTLDRLVAQALIEQEAHALHIVATDPAVVEAVHRIPAFQGPDGAFDRARFDQVLRANGLTEPRFLELMRADLRQRQLMEAVRAGATPPETLARAVFAFQGEKRAADMVSFPFAAVQPPAAPDEAVLKRWWENHPDDYRTPEYRRVKAVILAPQTLAKDVTITDDELKAAYEAHHAEYVTAAKRSAQIVSLADEAKAKAVAAAWRSGADWATVQDDAKSAQAVAIELNDAARAEFPSPELGAAVFDSPVGAVSGPVRAGGAWVVLRVTRETPGSERGFEQVKDELRDRLLAEKAADLIYDRANKVDNLLGGGATLDQLPGDLGLAAVTGTMDAAGNAMDGRPAPIPGASELRDAMVAAAFQARKGDPPHLVEVQTPSTGGSSYYALDVEEITPPAQKPFAEVKDQVSADWTADAARRAQEAAAAALLAEVKNGTPLADAAAKAGLTVTRSPLTGRGDPPAGMPAELVNPLFAAKPGAPTMVRTPDGFVVAVPAVVEAPDPKADPIGFSQARDGLARQIGDDIELLFVRALRDRTPPKVNQKLLDQIAQP